MPRIFVSYRREDTSGHAGRLYDVLAARFGTANVFMDVDTIGVGTDFLAAIDDALGASDVCLVLIGRNWLSPRLEEPTDYVRLEVERALASDVRVVPVCVQGAAIPAAEALPGPMAALALRQGTELRDASWRDDTDRLVRQLAGETGRRRLTGKQKVALGAGVLAAAGIAAGLGIAFSGGSSPASGANGTWKPSTPAEQRFLAAVPAAIRPSCKRYDAGPAAAPVTLECEGARATVDYSLFDDAATLNGWYVQQRETANILPGRGTCTAAHFHGEVSGRLCFLDSGRAARLVWTDASVLAGGDAQAWNPGTAATASLLRQWGCCLALQPRGA